MPPKTLHLVSIVLLALPSLAGCLASVEEPSPADAAALPAQAAPLPIAVALSGSFSARAVACPMVGCMGTPGQDERLFEIPDVEGDLAAVALALAWDAGTPAMETLVLGVFTCPPPCKTNEEIVALEYVEGASPLALDLSGFPVEEGTAVYVYVAAPSRTPFVYTRATTPQEFVIEGTLTPAAG